MIERLGFIGLGMMGQNMARNLLKAGYTLSVWNRTAEKARGLQAEGASWAESPAQLAKQCNIIFVCVSDTPDVQAVVLGEDGLWASLQAGQLIVDHSTISPQATKTLSAQLATRGVFWLDAPVSGGTEGAKNGTLSIMVGGDLAQVERIRPYLNAMGKTITHVGKNGDGQLVKLVNQVLVVINHLAVCEALLLAQVGGLDLTKTIEAVKGGAAGSWMLANRGPQVVARDWRPGFTIDLQLKDLRLVLETADHLGLPLETTAKIALWYRLLQHQGIGHEGNHALIKALEQLSGVVITG